MDLPARAVGRTGKLQRIAVCICVVVCIGLVIPYGPLFETALSAYNEFLGSWLAPEDSAANIEARSKNIPLKDLTEMLSYSNPVARAFAAKALAYKDDRAAFPGLIQALNDNRPFRDRSTGAEASVAELARASLTELLKAQITKEPENIGLLLPVFTAAERGSPAERRSLIEILGDIREPLSSGVMREASTERDAELAATAKTSLQKIDSPEQRNDKGAELDARQVRIAWSCALMMALLLWSVFRRFRQGLQTNIIVLSAVPMVLLGAFGAMVLSDHSEGGITDRRIAQAVRNGDLMTLRTMNYHDSTTYPGDSYVARFLLRTCDEGVIRYLAMLPTVQTTDSLPATAMTETRRRWILGRFIATNLGSPRLAALVNAADWEVRASVATALGKLGVRNEQVAETLARFSEDPNERVRKGAEEGLSRIKGFPVWLGQAVPK